MATKGKLPERQSLNGDTGNEREQVGKAELITISPPNLKILELKIRGTASYVQLRFGIKARNTMRETQEAGSVGKKGKKRSPKDFKENYEQAMYRGPNGEYGIPASAFRNACVDACRLVGFKMTHAKLGIFILADVNDATDGTQLVRITKGKPQYREDTVRNATGVADIRARAEWPEWEATLRIRYDADMFGVSDIANLIARVGMQVGVGEGRPNSKESCGMGWGVFEIVNE